MRSQLNSRIGGLWLPISFCIVLSAAVGCERMPEQQEPAPVLVRVNDETLTKREFDLFLPEDYENVLTSGEKQQYLDRWITTQLLYDEVLRSGVPISPDVEARLEQYRKDLIADQLVQSVIEEKAIVTESEIRAYWEQHAHEYQTEFRVSHILTNTIEDAEAVQERLGKQSFAYLARRFSIDKHSGSGGDLGYLSRGNMIPEFENVVFGMKVGDVSGIIESEFGYHTIMVTDIREAKVKLDYEDVRDEIADMLTLQKRKTVYDSLVTSLRSRAHIEIMEEALMWVAADSIAIEP